MLKYIVPLAALMLVGCNTMVHDYQLDQQKPVSKLTRASIAARIQAEVKDPYSIRDAQIAHGVPNGHATGANTQFVCVSFNAKNGYGAYTGVESHAVGVRDGSATDVWWNAPHCRNQPRLKWQSFPELNGR